MLAHRHLDVLEHGERGEQGAELEHHPEPPVDRLALGRGAGPDIDAEDLDAAGPLRDEAEDGAQQHGLAGAGGADHAEDLAAIGVEIEVLDDVDLAEARGEPAHRDHHLAAGQRSVLDLGELVTHRQ